LIPLSVFVAMTLGTWSVLGLVATRPKSAELRLKRLLDPHAVEIAQAKRQEQVQAKVAAAANRLGQSLRPSDAQELGKIRTKLMNAGFRHEQAVAVLYGIKFILL
jgi:tight adherence protein C